ncbi:MAG: diaminopimelate epimerase [Bacteroidales bacterium]|nr:diaminopimelate epimerase [Bacteroidales bacterium]MDD4362042.1 diaminopimelate epimerase [Bacteroidales bacterium]
MKTIEFTKMHGAGNDYIYVDAAKYPLQNPEKLAIKWSRPHFGIGADGLVLICSSEVADFRMRIFNADGSEATMCGNASRCIGKYVYENGLSKKTELTLETLAGIKKLNLEVKEGKVSRLSVNMGQAVIKGKAVLEAKGILYSGWIVSMGNPHFVIIVNDLAAIDLPLLGPLLGKHPMFESGTNVEFVQVLSRKRLRMRVWERGSGITLACGTGASASVVAASAAGKCADRVTVEMDGGELEILLDSKSREVLMCGDAVKVFQGQIDLD